MWLRAFGAAVLFLALACTCLPARAAEGTVVTVPWAPDPPPVVAPAPSQSPATAGVAGETTPSTVVPLPSNASPLPTTAPPQVVAPTVSTSPRDERIPVPAVIGTWGWNNASPNMGLPSGYGYGYGNNYGYVNGYGNYYGYGSNYGYVNGYSNNCGYVNGGVYSAYARPLPYGAGYTVLGWGPWPAGTVSPWGGGIYVVNQWNLSQPGCTGGRPPMPCPSRPTGGPSRPGGPPHRPHR